MRWPLTLDRYAPEMKNWQAGEGDRVCNREDFVVDDRTFPAGTRWIVVLEPSSYDGQILLSKIDDATFIRVGRREWESFSQLE